MFVCLYDRFSFVALYYYAMVVDFIIITHDDGCNCSGASVLGFILNCGAWCSIFLDGKEEGRKHALGILWAQQKVMYMVIS